MNIVKHRSTHAGKLERWLGKERIVHLGSSMKGWYGRPISILDIPGGVKIGADGDFTGKISRGSFMSAMDSLEAMFTRAAKVSPATFYAGFTSISDALSRASQGYSQRVNFNKVGATGVVGGTNSLWRVGPQPAVGSAPSNAPGGSVFTSANTGALPLANTSPGTIRLIGADVSSSVINNSLLVYDLLWGCNKTMANTGVEGVTGVPTRYQSSTPTAEDYAGDNFLMVQVGGTALAANGHNWTTCLYRNQAGTDNRTLPSLTGNSGAIADRLDHPLQQWFAPLDTGDTGIMDLAQMQCSASVATGVVWFMIGHPLGFMSFPIINSMMPFDWLTNRDQTPRIFNDACVTFLEPLKPATTATTYTGRLVYTSTSS